MPVDKLIKLRRDTTTNWTTVNPVLGSGELGFETTTGFIKCGDGVTNWNSLNYISKTTLTGDVTGSGTGTFTTTIAANAVTSDKFRKSAAASVVGNPGKIPAEVTDITGSPNQILKVSENGETIGFGRIDLSAPESVIGILQKSSMPELMGDVTNIAGAVETTIGNNVITGAKFRQSPAASIVGNPGSAIANVSDITGSADTVLRMNSNGTGLAFGAIDLSKSAAATGLLQAASFPAMTGDVTSTGGAVATTISDNAVSNNKIRKSLGLSIIGNSSNAEKDVSDITGVNDQVLRVGDNKLEFGAIDLSKPAAARGILQEKSFPAMRGDITSLEGSLDTSIGLGRVKNEMLAGKISASKLIGNDISEVGNIIKGGWSAGTIAAKFGGTGNSTYVVGDMLFADTASTLAKLTSVEKGSALISGGIAAPPVWGKIGLKTHISEILPVANGGTNSGTELSNNRHMISSGGAIVESAAALNGQLLIGSTGAAPVIAALTPGYGTIIKNGPGTISLGTSLTTAQTNLVAVETTTSIVDGALSTPITGIPTAGTYLIIFSCTMGANPTTAASTIISLYTGLSLETATQEVATERVIRNGSGGQGGSAIGNVTFQTIVKFTGSSVYDIRWRCTSGVSSIFNRQLTLIRVE
jgi:hypothetical protein